MGGCRSAADALQSAGRIRPKKQLGEGSEVIFWKDESSTNRRSEESISSQDYRAEAHFYAAFENLSITEQSAAKADITGLYEAEGLEGIFYGEPNQCISRGLHSQMGVKVNDCGICEYCRGNISHS